jgi:MFS family permease
VDDPRASSPLSIAAFRKYLAARFLASISVQMLSVAVGVQVYAATGRARDLALVGLVQFVPMLLCVLPAGRAADAWDGRSIAWWCDVGFVIVAGVLCASVGQGARATWWVFLALAVLGVARSFYGPAVATLLPNIVGPELLQRAVAVQAGTWQVAAIGGPALAGLLYATGSPLPVYAVAFVGNAVALVLMGWLRRDASVVLPPRASSDARRASGALDGLRFVWNHEILLAVLSLDFLAVFLGGATALLPVLVKDVLHRGDSVVGLLRAAPAVGAAVVSLFLAREPIRAGVGRKLLASVMVFGVATVVFGLSRELWLSTLCLLVLGASDTISVVVRGTLVQRATPTAMRGRVSAVNQLFVSASNELGEFESGVLAELAGPVNAVVLGGVGTIAVVIASAFRFDKLRTLERVEDAAASE